MENLSSYLNRKFAKSLIWLLTTTFTVTLLAVLVWGYISTSKNLKESSVQSSSLVTSLLYDKNWALVNEYFDLWSERSSLTFIEVKSKFDSKSIYQANFKRTKFVPVICDTDESSHLITLRVCAQVFSSDIFVTILLLLGGYVFFIVITYYFFKKKISEGVIDLSKQVYGLIENSESSLNNFFSNIEELERIRSIIWSKTEQIKRVTQANAFFELSRKIAHDIRSPVAVIENLLNKKGMTDMDKEIVIASCSSLTDMANKLLIETSSKRFMNNVRYNLASKLKRLAKMKVVEYGYALTESSFKLSIDQNVYLWLPEVEFDRVLSNIINNAFQANNADLLISFESTKDSKFWMLHIVDNGPGFSEVFLNQFRKGEQLKSTKLSGHGIGLNSATEFLRSIGSKMELSNNSTKGARISISIPLSRLMNNDTPIILIDDDKYIRHSWSILAKERGYVFYAFSSIKEFEENQKELDKKSEVFIDSELKDGTNGEMYVSTLYELGYTKINIQTGKSPADFQGLEKLNTIVSKKFPY